MKTILYTLTLILLTLSCRSIDKMVEQGRYDEAIIFAAQKLAGKKNKKTKHVKGLETAFAKLTRMEMNEINEMDGTNNPHNWDRIYRLAQKIDSRQRRVEAFLPLVSKDGYKADFEFVRTDVVLAKAREGAAEYHYNEALQLLEASFEGDKMAARQAFNKLKDVRYYKESYKDLNRLLNTALEIGQTHVGVQVINNSYSILPVAVDEIMRSVSVQDLNTTWKRFYLTEEPDSTLDYIAVLEITRLDVSPERETVEHYTDSKQVKDGWKYVLDENGNVKKDTLGNDIKEDHFKTVTAQITEIFREKAAYIEGRLRYQNLRTGETISSRPVSVEAVFNDYASRYRGDKRALGDRCRRRLKDYPAPFPDDFAMVLDATENLKAAFKDALYELRI